MTSPDVPPSEASLHAAQMRRLYESNRAALSGVLALDMARYEIWMNRFGLIERDARLDEQAWIREHTSETIRLLSNAMNAIARLGRHLDG